jgi:osmotically-inducible protein OsmY
VSTLRVTLWLALCLGLTTSLCGCPLAIVGGVAAAGGAGYAANQERGVGGTANDFSIKTNIQAALAKTDPEMAAHLDVTVYEGRVLLTGSAPDPQIKAAAGEAAKSVPGVRAVYDEVEVAPSEGAWNLTKDAWITSRVRSSLVFSDIRSVNYNVETVDGSVYLIGSARSRAELNHATDLARNVQGVRRVVSYVEIRPGEPPGSQQAESPPPVYSAAPPGPETPVAPAPSTPVEVQKL